MRSVHICSLGFKPEVILDPIMGGGLPCDKLFLLWNDNEKINDTLRQVKECISVAKSRIEIDTMTIDPLDYNSTIKAVKEISVEEKKVNKDIELFINITPGTGITVGALCAASYFIEKAQVYYYIDPITFEKNLPLSDLIVKINNPKIPDIERMDRFQKMIIKHVASSENKRVSTDSVKKLIAREKPSYMDSEKRVGAVVSYHLKALERDGLIELAENEVDRRKKDVISTDLGTMLSLWLPD